MKAIIFLADGFETAEALVTKDLLERAGIKCDLSSITNDIRVTSAQDVEIYCDNMIKAIDFDDYECIILPGGTKGVEKYSTSKKLQLGLINANNNNKLIAAICAAPSYLGEIHLLNNRAFTCYPGCEKYVKIGIYKNDRVVIDGNLITAKAMGATAEFAKAIITYLLDSETANSVFSKLYYKKNV